MTYEVAGFLDKNRDTINENMMTCLTNTESEFVAALYNIQDEESESAPAPPKSAGRASGTIAPSGSGTVRAKTTKRTVGMQFKDSLNALMGTLTATNPYYVRCVKPNTLKAAHNFDKEMVAAQLRYAGMMETIRIRRSGFPIRMTHVEFYKRYLVLDSTVRMPSKEAAAALIAHLESGSNGMAREEWQMGKTKVFFRDFQHRRAEGLRDQALTLRVQVLQNAARMRRERKDWLAAGSAATILQCGVRGWLERKNFRQKCASVLQIQSVWRMHRERTRYRLLQGQVLLI